MAKFNFYCGAAASAWLLAILVVAAELSAPFKSLLKSTFAHHWIGKAVLITLAFVLAGFLLKDRETFLNMPKGKVAWYSVLASLLIIFLFYLIEFLS